VVGSTLCWHCATASRHLIADHGALDCSSSAMVINASVAISFWRMTCRSARHRDLAQVETRRRQRRFVLPRTPVHSWRACWQVCPVLDLRFAPS
jgi:hypothetical protein